MSGSGDQQENVEEEEKVLENDNSKALGCEHYKRKCALISPCCNTVYTCRVCHDEKENHLLIRKDVRSIQCLKCGVKQKVKSNCENCEVKFGNYFCEKCCLFDDEDKKQFHCGPCGLSLEDGFVLKVARFVLNCVLMNSHLVHCRDHPGFLKISAQVDFLDRLDQRHDSTRVGGRQNYFHCEKCDVCLANDLKDNHTCVEKSSRSNCAICLEHLHTSRNPAHIPPCDHLIHYDCYVSMMKTGNYTCPICNLSMVDMSDVWKQLDEEITATPMPEEYKDYQVQILCRDCHKESRVVFHVLGLKCQECGSYNTTRAAEPENNDATGKSGAS